MEHRLYGFFGPGQGEFTILIASSDKKKQNSTINDAKKLKKQYERAMPELETYDV